MPRTQKRNPPVLTTRAGGVRRQMVRHRRIQKSSGVRGLCPSPILSDHPRKCAFGRIPNSLHHFAVILKAPRSPVLRTYCRARATFFSTETLFVSTETHFVPAYRMKYENKYQLPQSPTLPSPISLCPVAFSQYVGSTTQTMRRVDNPTRPKLL
jgi:hypothetical protein